MKNNNTYIFALTLVATLGGLLFGYDTAVISGTVESLRKFFIEPQGFPLDQANALEGFVVSSALIGCILGASFAGWISQRYGRKPTLILAAILFLLSAIGSAWPELFIGMPGSGDHTFMYAFVAYRILGGIGVGLASMVSPMYIAEVAPFDRRGNLVAWNQFAIIFGQLVVYFVNFLILGEHTQPVIERIGEAVYQVHSSSDPWTISTGWRYMFGSEAFVAGLFTILVFFVPESPRYLVLTGRDDAAMNVLSHINGYEKAREILNQIKSTAAEKSEKLFSFGIMVIFIGVMLSVFQQAVGINAVLYYAPRIFESMNMGNPMVQTVIMGIVNIAFTLVAVFTVEKIGRKPLLIWGSIGMAVGAFGVAVSNIVTVAPIVPVVSIMVYSASFMFSWGPICWVLISEIFPNTIRSSAVAIAVAFQWIFNFIVSSTFVPMYNMSAGDLGDRFGHVFVYALYGIICVIAAWFVAALVPETKGKTLEDMTNLWRNRNKKA